VTQPGRMLNLSCLIGWLYQVRTGTQPRILSARESGKIGTEVLFDAIQTGLEN
jgi:hypothetical protein